MLQLEREKAGHQLAEIQKLKETLDKIDTNSKHKNVALGSLVITSNLNYFIAISAGEFVLNKVSYYAISASTPIAKLLLSREEGETVEFRDSKFSINSIQ